MRRLRLTQKDYSRIEMEYQIPFQSRPRERSFNRSKCINTIKTAQQRAGEESYIVRHWLERDKARCVGIEEAHFWLKAIYYWKQLKSTDAMLDFLNNMESQQILSLEDFLSIEFDGIHTDTLVHLVWRFYGQDGIINFLKKNNPESTYFAQWTRRELLSYLTVEERHSLCQAMTPLLNAASLPAFLELGLALDVDREIFRTIISEWPDGSAVLPDRKDYRDNTKIPVITTLRDPLLISKELRRLKAFPNSGDDAIQIIAATEFECLDFIAECARDHYEDYKARDLTDALLMTESPETALALATAALNPATKTMAQQWWIAHPYFAIQGLAPILQERSERGRIALFWLHYLKSQHGIDFVESALQDISADAGQLVHDHVLYPSLPSESLAGSDISACVQSLTQSDISPDISAIEVPERRVNSRPFRTPEPLESSFQQVPAPPPPLFNFHTAIAQLSSLYINQKWEIRKQNHAFPMNPKEAHFWIAAHDLIQQTANDTLTPEVMEDKLSQISLGSSFDISLLSGYDTSYLIVPAWILFGVNGLFKTCGILEIRYRFSKNLLPYLSIMDRNIIADSALQKIREQSNDQWLVTYMLELMATLPVSPKLLETAILEADNKNWEFYDDNPLLDTLLRLEDSSRIAQIAQEKSIYPKTQEEILQWLAVTGFQGCDIAREKAKDLSREARAHILTSIESPEVAADIAALRKFPTSQVIAQTWLECFPAFAIEGLLPLLVDNDPKRIELAASCLSEFNRKGYRWLIAKQKESCEPLAQAAIDRLVLSKETGKEHRITPKDKEFSSQLPTILLNKGCDVFRLTPEQSASLIATLRETPLNEPSPTLELVRQNADRTSLDRFLWVLFQRWIHSGMPNRERWKYEALGHLGGNFIARQLAPLILSWPYGEREYGERDKTQPYIKMGLECLRAIGSEVADLQLVKIYLNTHERSLQKRAGDYIDSIRAAHKLASGDDIDRYTPDASLDQSCTYTFDLGARQFTLCLASDLIPVFKDKVGKPRTELPRAGKYDSRTRAARAMETWEWMEKELTIARERSQHLKQAQLNRRRWTGEMFYQNLVRHSLLGLMIQGIVWGIYDTEEKLIQPFRVTSERTLADTQDSPWSLPKSAPRIGIVHPDDLSTELQELWLERLADYEIFPPFVQFERGVTA